MVPIGKARVARAGTRRQRHHLRRHGAYRAGCRGRLWQKKASNWKCSICVRCCRWTARPSRETVRRTNRVIVLHEDMRTGGIAGEIAAIINEEAFDALDAPIVRITALDTPVPFSPPLEEHFLPKAADVVREARRLVELLNAVCASEDYGHCGVRGG